MKKLILSFLLHHANRLVWILDDKQSFYTIKDSLLKQYGQFVRYDVQHIPGKRCRSCKGSGEHVKYSWDPPYEAYGWDMCWRCNGTGWFKLPQWNLLSVLSFGSYCFHSPKKREYCVKNPWTEEALGWEPSKELVIEGYIEHKHSSFSKLSMLVIFYLYNKHEFKFLLKSYKRSLRWKIQNKIYRIKNFKWSSLILEKPTWPERHWFRSDGELEELPF